MSKWLYFGSREIGGSFRLTLPPVLFKEDILPSDDRAHVFWFWNDDEQRVGIANRPPFKYSFESLTQDSSSITETSGSKSTTFLEQFREWPEADISFSQKDTIYFVATKEMMQDKVKCCYLLTKEQLNEINTDIDIWLKTKANTERLLEDDILSLSSLKTELRRDLSDKLGIIPDIDPDEIDLESLDQIYESSLTSTSFSKFIQAVENESKKWGDLADDEMAALLVAHEFSNPKVKISEIQGDMDRVHFIGDVVRIGKVRKFELDGGKIKQVVTIDVKDDTGKVPVVLDEYWIDTVLDEIELGRTLGVNGQPIFIGRLAVVVSKFEDRIYAVKSPPLVDVPADPDLFDMSI